jgi:hypothetical protein
MTGIWWFVKDLKWNNRGTIEALFRQLAGGNEENYEESQTDLPVYPELGLLWFSSDPSDKNQSGTIWVKNPSAYHSGYRPQIPVWKLEICEYELGVLTTNMRYQLNYYTNIFRE